MKKQPTLLATLTLLLSASVLYADDQPKHPHMGSVQPLAKFELLTGGPSVGPSTKWDRHRANQTFRRVLQLPALRASPNLSTTVSH